MATEKKNGFNPLSEEELQAIQDMSIDDLLSSVHDTLNAPAGASTAVPVKSAAPAAEKTAVPAAAATAVLERQETMVYQDLAAADQAEAAPAVEETAVVPPVKPAEAPEFLKTKPKKEKKARKFGKFILIYVLAFLVVIAGGLTALWMYLESYEASRPEHVVEHFLDNVDDAYWEELVSISSSVFATSQFEDGSEIAMQCFDALRGEDYSYRKRTGEYTEEAPVYTIRVGGTDLAKLTLRENGSAGFGFNYWAANTVELVPEFVPAARTVEIEVPQSAAVTLNGVLLDASYVTSTVPAEELSELELAFTTGVPSLAVYSVPGLYGNVELYVEDADGTELFATHADGELYTYAMNITETYDVTITAPTGAEVVLNGAVVPESYITGTEAYDLLSGSADYLPEDLAAEVSIYTVNGLLSPVETVTATAADGKALAGSQGEDGNWSFGWGTQTIPSNRKELVDEYMDAYLSFSADEGDATDYNWGVIQGYLLYEGDAYERCYMALDGLEWTRSSDAVLNSVDVISYAEFGEECFVVRVTMNSTVSRANGDTTEENTFDVVFVLDGEEWLVERMEAV